MADTARASMTSIKVKALLPKGIVELTGVPQPEGVAQASGLLYRRPPACWTTATHFSLRNPDRFRPRSANESVADSDSDRPQIRNLRYSRLKICATRQALSFKFFIAHLLCFVCSTSPCCNPLTCSPGWCNRGPAR